MWHHRRPSLGCVFGCVCGLIPAILAQNGTAQNIGQPASLPTTIQLPSFSRFTYSGSVLVPDGGTASLGGVSRSYSGRSSPGRLSGRAAGGSLGHSGASVHVTIIDNDAIDREIRGLPPRGSSLSPKADRPGATVADPDGEGKALVRFARKQFLNGNRASAFDAYRLAIETLSPELSTLAAAEFRRVFPSAALTGHVSRQSVGDGPSRNTAPAPGGSSRADRGAGQGFEGRD